MPTKTKQPSVRYLLLAQELREQMRRGALKPGDRLPSFAEMRAQGISQNTTEKVHALLEREHLVERRHRAGVFVANSNERKPRAGILGVAGKGFSFREYSPYWVSLLGSIRHVADDAARQLLLVDHESNTGWEKADGMLLCDWSNHLTLQWLPPGMPCVSLLVPAQGIVSVYADDYHGGFQAAEHLLRLGHRRVAFLHSKDVFVSGRRVAGYRDALVAAGITPREEWMRNMHGELDFGVRFTARGHAGMQEWLQTDWKKSRCTAIIAQNDETAMGIIQALREAKIRVPQDVSVVGFDGMALPEYSPLSLTTVAVPLAEIGAAATRLLLRQLDGESVGAQHRVFPVALREGQSTARAKLS